MNIPDNRFDIKSWLVLADWYEEKKSDCASNIIKNTIIRWIDWVKEKGLCPFSGLPEDDCRYCWQNDELDYGLKPQHTLPKSIFDCLLDDEYSRLPYDKYYSTADAAWNDLLLAWIEYEANNFN